MNPQNQSSVIQKALPALFTVCTGYVLGPGSSPAMRNLRKPVSQFVCNRVCLQFVCKPVSQFVCNLCLYPGTWMI